VYKRGIGIVNDDHRMTNNISYYSHQNENHRCSSPMGIVNVWNENQRGERQLSRMIITKRESPYSRWNVNRPSRV
jgi:hypothetical protein